MCIFSEKNRTDPKKSPEKAIFAPFLHVNHPNKKHILTMKKTFAGICALGGLVLARPEILACTRALYHGVGGMVATGRTMDWAENLHSNIHIFPQGIHRRGAISQNTISWISKYGSIAVSGYDIGIADGLNEKGLAANLLFLPETDYNLPDNDNRPVMGLSIWTQYVLDNFASVDEAVNELAKQSFRIDAPDLPGGKQSKLHLAISDASGDSAILEYVAGQLLIYHGPQYQVLTNSPLYPQQLAVNEYWQQIGGTIMLPGTNRSADRFARTSFYINAVTQSDDPKVAIPTLLSVMHNAAVPNGITTPDKPYISSTQWISMCDHKNRIYYFEPIIDMQLLWIDLAHVDLSPGSGERILQLDGRTETFVGDVTALLAPAVKPFTFLLEE